jgi:hypothetical protein
VAQQVAAWPIATVLILVSNATANSTAPASVGHDGFR